MNQKIPSRIPEEDLLKHSEAYFIHKVFGYIMAPHHKRMLDHIQNTNQTLVLAPRGSGKTKICDIGHIAYKILNNPNERLLLLSDTHNHSIRFLNTIKTVLSTSPIVKQYYGDIVGDKWTDMEIVTALRTDNSITEASVTATGMYGSYVTSGHFTEVVCDDLITFENSRSKLQRDRTDNWFKTTLLPTLLPNATIRVIGTLYHYADLYNTLIEQLGYKALIMPAIINMGTPKARSLWETFMPLNTKIINGQKIKGLLQIKEDIGSLIFGLQYMLSAELQKSGQIFKWDWFNFYDKAPLKLKIYQGIDLAISKKSTADFFVIVTIGIDPLGNVYVLDIYRERGVSFNSQVQLIQKKAEEWKPLKIGIESNSYQAALAQEVQRLSLLPVIEIPTSKDKIMRAQMRSGLVESGRVYVKSSMHDFVSELVLLDSTTGEDDQFDAFDFCLTVAEESNEDRVQEGYFIPEFDAGY